MLDCPIVLAINQLAINDQVTLRITVAGPSLFPPKISLANETVLYFLQHTVTCTRAFT